MYCTCCYITHDGKVTFLYILLSLLRSAWKKGRPGRAVGWAVPGRDCSVVQVRLLDGVGNRKVARWKVPRRGAPTGRLDTDTVFVGMDRPPETFYT